MHIVFLEKDVQTYFVMAAHGFLLNLNYKLLRKNGEKNLYSIFIVNF